MERGRPYPPKPRPDFSNFPPSLLCHYNPDLPPSSHSISQTLHNSSNNVNSTNSYNPSTTNNPSYSFPSSTISSNASHVPASFPPSEDSHPSQSFHPSQNANNPQVTSSQYSNSTQTSNSINKNSNSTQNYNSSQNFENSNFPRNSRNSQDSNTSQSSYPSYTNNPVVATEFDLDVFNNVPPFWSGDIYSQTDDKICILTWDKRWFFFYF